MKCSILKVYSRVYPPLVWKRLGEPPLPGRPAETQWDRQSRCHHGNDCLDTEPLRRVLTSHPDLWSTGVEVEHRDVGDKEGEEEEGGLLTERGVVGEEGDGDAKGEDEEKREEAWSLQHKQRSS